MQNVINELQQYRAVRQQVAALGNANKNQEAYALYINKAVPLENVYHKALRNMANNVMESATALDSQNQANGYKAAITMVVIIVASILLGMLIGYTILKNITTRMHDIVEYLAQLSNGDFSSAISQDFLEDRSEFGEVARAVHKMQDEIKELLTKMTSATEQLATASEELSASAEQSAQASNQVANSVTGVADSAEKQLQLVENANSVTQSISQAMTQMADYAQTVSGSAENTAHSASEGGTAISQAVAQMQTIEKKTNDTSDVIGQLEEKSKQIGQIVDVISNIAGQTNLLALNAAIEAARAGEAGKGFAVVAEEVRKLAEQSQNAAKQITTLITEVQKQTNEAVVYMNDGKEEVTKGATVVSTAGQSFDKILDMVVKMTDQIRDISASVEEVTGGIQEVVNSMQNIDEESKKSAEETQTISAATEEQSASVEEIANASQNLSQMAGDLQSAIRQFKI